MARTPGMLKALPEDFLLCRTYGHMWEPWHTDQKAPWGYYEVVHCGRCGMDRFFTIDGLGRVSSRRYEAPDGYELGADAPRREKFRMEVHNRGFYASEVRRRSPRKVTKKKKPAAKRAHLQAVS